MAYEKNSPHGQKGGRNDGPRINERIRASEVRLVGEDGHPYGVLSIDEAKQIASDAGLDLVEVSPNARPPVVKLIDYGKYRYEQQKKAAEAKKKQVTIALKEIQFRPNIEQHDLEVKLKRSQTFLENGDKVKMIMQFRGREMANRDIGLKKFHEIIKQIEAGGVAIVESPLKFMGNRALVILASSVKKKPKIEKKS